MMKKRQTGLVAGDLRRLSRFAPRSVKSLVANQPVALVEANSPDSRVIVSSPPTLESISWAVLSPATDPIPYVSIDGTPLCFASDPFAGFTYAYSTLYGNKAYLCASTVSDGPALLYFDPDEAAQKVPVFATGDSSSFGLTIMNAQGDELDVCSSAPSVNGSWSWLYGSNSGVAAQFAVEYFGLGRDLLLELMLRQWPDLILDYLGQGDDYYGVMPQSTAKDVWSTAGLDSNMYVADVFDCEDFSYVYKGCVSLRQSVDNAAFGLPFAYAAGSIVGDATDDAHAVNVFLDETFTIQILEPQTGDIVPGSQWSYTPRTIWL